MKQKKKLNLSGTFAIVLALLVLLIFIPINLIVSYFDKGFDMTPSKKYTLDDKTVDLINSNSDKTIEIYFLYKLEELTRSDANELLPLYHTLTQLKEFDNIVVEIPLTDDADIDSVGEKVTPRAVIEGSDGKEYIYAEVSAATNDN